MSKVDMSEVWKLKDQGYLKCQSWYDEIFVFNYTPKAEFEKNWNWYTRNLRGAVLDKNGNFVSRAIPKFFNVDSEMEESKYSKLPRHLPCQITNKLDGSLIHLFWNSVADDWQVSSKCSFANDYTEAAAHYIREKLKSRPDRDLSYCFEIRFPEDTMRRVTDLKDDLYFITAFEVGSGKEMVNFQAPRLNASAAISP